MKETRGLAWWLFWRYSTTALVCGFLAGAIVGAIFGMLVASVGGSVETVRTFAPYLGGAVGLVVSFFLLNFFLARMIGKNIGNQTINIQKY